MRCKCHDVSEEFETEYFKYLHKNPRGRVDREYLQSNARWVMRPKCKCSAAIP